MNFLFSYETLEIMKAMDWLIWGWCFVIYTIVRIRELQEAEWAEFKLEDDNPIWSIQVEKDAHGNQARYCNLPTHAGYCVC